VNDWRGNHTGHAGTIKFESGPAEGRCPIQVGDGVILAASGWSRILAAVRIVDGPDRAREPRWGPRWPWVRYAEAVAWVERMETGPKIVDAGLPRSYGASYQRISEEQYERGRASRCTSSTAHKAPNHCCARLLSIPSPPAADLVRASRRLWSVDKWFPLTDNRVMAKYGQNREFALCDSCGHPKMAHLGGPCHCGCRGTAGGLNTSRASTHQNEANRRGDPVASARQKHPRAYEPWSAEEDQRLSAALAIGASIGELSASHERQPSAIRSRVRKLEERAAREISGQAAAKKTMVSPSSETPRLASQQEHGTADEHRSETWQPRRLTGKQNRAGQSALTSGAP
jgi:hypothetical protein